MVIYEPILTKFNPEKKTILDYPELVKFIIKYKDKLRGKK